MPLEITQREMNGIYLLALKGRLVLGEESSGLLTTIDNLLASGATRMVINLEQVHYVDSAGLGALIEMQRKTKGKGRSLKLCHLRPNLRQAVGIALRRPPSPPPQFQPHTAPVTAPTRPLPTPTSNTPQ